MHSETTSKGSAREQSSIVYLLDLVFLFILYSMWIIKKQCSRVVFGKFIHRNGSKVLSVNHGLKNVSLLTCYIQVSQGNLLVMTIFLVGNIQTTLLLKSRLIYQYYIYKIETPKQNLCIPFYENNAREEYKLWRGYSLHRAGIQKAKPI